MAQLPSKSETIRNFARDASKARKADARLQTKATPENITGVFYDALKFTGDTQGVRPQKRPSNNPSFDNNRQAIAAANQNQKTSSLPDIAQLYNQNRLVKNSNLPESQNLPAPPVILTPRNVSTNTLPAAPITQVKPKPLPAPPALADLKLVRQQINNQIINSLNNALPKSIAPTNSSKPNNITNVLPEAPSFLSQTKSDNRKLPAPPALADLKLVRQLMDIQNNKIKGQIPLPSAAAPFDPERQKTLSQIDGQHTQNVIGHQVGEPPIIPPSPPIVDFTADVTFGCIPLSVNFTNLTVNASSYYWDFGNGITSTLVNPSANFINAGGYTVSLYATGSNGSSHTTKTNYISTVDCVPVSNGVVFFADMNWLVTEDTANNRFACLELFNIFFGGARNLQCAAYVNELANVYSEEGYNFGVYYTGAPDPQSMYTPVLGAALTPAGYTFSPVDITVPGAAVNVTKPFVMHLYLYSTIFSDTVMQNLTAIAQKVPVIWFGEYNAWTAYDNRILAALGYNPIDLSYDQDLGPGLYGYPNPDNSLGQLLINAGVTVFEYNCTGTFKGAYANQYAFAKTAAGLPSMLYIPAARPTGWPICDTLSYPNGTVYSPGGSAINLSGGNGWNKCWFAVDKTPFINDTFVYSIGSAVNLSGGNGWGNSWFTVDKTPFINDTFAYSIGSAVNLSSGYGFGGDWFTQDKLPFINDTFIYPIGSAVNLSSGYGFGGDWLTQDKLPFINDTFAYPIGSAVNLSSGYGFGGDWFTI
tara:strand:+ start:2775 stop:5048 length:2274 start_codon:yes stop_codon:yes gene_type:complete